MELQLNDSVVLVRESDDAYTRIIGVVSKIEDLGSVTRPCVHTVIKTIHNGHRGTVLLVNGLPYKGSYKIIKLDEITDPIDEKDLEVIRKD